MDSARTEHRIAEIEGQEEVVPVLDVVLRQREADRADARMIDQRRVDDVTHPVVGRSEPLGEHRVDARPQEEPVAEIEGRHHADRRIALGTVLRHVDRLRMERRPVGRHQHG